MTRIHDVTHLAIRERMDKRKCTVGYKCGSTCINIRRKCKSGGSELTKEKLKKGSSGGSNTNSKENSKQGSSGGDPVSQYAQLMKQQQELVKNGDIEGAMKMVAAIKEAAMKAAESPVAKTQVRQLESQVQSKRKEKAGEDAEFASTQAKRNERQLAAKLNSIDKKAIRDYTDADSKYGRSFESVNNCLRFPSKCTDARTQKKFTQEMDTALSKLPKNDDGDRFYRGVVSSGPTKALYDQLKNAEPGMKIKDPGYASYSSQRSMAEKFADNEGRYQERILFVSRNKSITAINMYSELKDENEAVLPRGVEQTVRRVTQDGKTLIVELD